MISSRLQYTYFFILSLGAIILLYFIFKPFIIAFFLAIICAVMFGGLHEKMLERMPRRKNIAAFISVCLVLIFIIVPLFIVGTLVLNEAVDFYNSFSKISTPAGFLNDGLLALQKNLQAYAPQIHLDLQSYAHTGLQWMLSNATRFFSGFLKIILDLFIMVITLFYLFRDGKQLRQYFITLSPFEQKDDEDILKKLALTINSVIKGTIIISLVQGFFTTIGFMVFGISQPVLWGVVAAVASLVPGIGTALVHIPAIIFLFAFGHTFEAFGYIIWSTLLTGSVDNILSPFLIERKVKIHPVLILVSVLGGLAFFGPIGFLAGPIILAFASELTKLYPKFVKHEASHS